MGLLVDIEKELSGFRLRARFEAGEEPMALLGASGSGKSVTLRCIAGVMTPDTGRIILDGVTLFDSARKINLPPRQRHVGYLFQHFALFPNMSVEGNIAAAVADRRTRRETVSQLLRRFQLETVAHERPAQLSGGQRQRTALARVLASQPRALLLDEPFSALDGYLRYQLELEMTQTLDAFPGTILWVSHDRGEVFRCCRRVCVMDRGATHPAQSLRELFHAPPTEAAARLTGCTNFTDAVPQGERVLLPQWGVTLSWGRAVPAGARRMGVRARFVRPEAGENAFECQVARVVEDVFTTTVLLRPVGAAPDAPLLGMEMDKAAWRERAREERVWVSIEPRDIMLFEDEELSEKCT